jgi:hypothetical protein
MMNYQWRLRRRDQPIDNNLCRIAWLQFGSADFTAVAIGLGAMRRRGRFSPLIRSTALALHVGNIHRPDPSMIRYSNRQWCGLMRIKRPLADFVV